MGGFAVSEFCQVHLSYSLYTADRECMLHSTKLKLFVRLYAFTGLRHCVAKPQIPICISQLWMEKKDEEQQCTEYFVVLGASILLLKHESTEEPHRAPKLTMLPLAVAALITRPNSAHKDHPDSSSILLFFRRGISSLLPHASVISVSRLSYCWLLSKIPSIFSTQQGLP